MTMYINTFKYLLISVRNIQSASCVAPPEDEQVSSKYVESVILNQFNEKCITLVSLYRCTMMHGRQNIK
jgi:hypothetical protein